MFYQVTLAVLGLVVLFSFPLLWWLVRYRAAGRNSPRVLLYHKIDKRPELGGTWNLPFQFENHMRYLRERDLEVVSLEELIRGNPDQRRVAITFDDGYQDIYLWAFPILKSLGFPATVFLIAGYVGEENLWDVTLGRRFRHLTWSQIEEMSKFGISFGSHTMTHPDLTRISLHRVRYELEESKRSLEFQLGKEVKYLSYPFGRYNRDIQTTAEAVGYLACFCSYPAAQDSGSERYSLGRSGMYIIDTLFDFRAKIDRANLLLFGGEEIKGRLINAFSHGTPIAKGIWGRT